MRFTELRQLGGAVAAGWLGVLAGCSPPAPPVPPPVAPRVAPSTVQAGRAAPAETPSSKAIQAERAPTLPLPPPRPVTSWDDVRRQAARRIVAASPNGTYSGAEPDPLLAIPVLQIELRHDGSVARVVILRAPRQAKDTTALAIAAVHRAAPFGDVSRLPRPWRFTETFLFDDERKFKPRTLVE